MKPACLALLLVGCVGSGGVEPAPDGGAAVDYATYVHPILEARCAPLDCHGDPGRPLRLYAQTGLRAADGLRFMPITPAELDLNVRSLAAVDPGVAPEESLVMTKPLAGGVGHAGGDVWTSPDDPEAVCLLGWLAGRTRQVGLTCQAAIDGIPPLPAP